ncbi:LamG-like jellyroll fold domain-containing protein, partial [Nodularia harveyana UHCC-0300]
DRLYYRVGKLDVENQTVTWSASQEYDTGSLTSISLDHQGNCLETHVGSDRLYYRVGKLDVENQTVTWSASQEYDTGALTSISLDHQGNCLETHVGSDRLYYRLGKLDVENQTVTWSASQEYDTGALTSISLDHQGNCLETHVGSDRLYYRLGKLTNTQNLASVIIIPDSETQETTEEENEPIQSELVFNPTETSPVAAPENPLIQPRLVFNGEDFYIDLGRKPEFKISQRITVEAWINCQAQRRRTGIITNIFHTNTIASGYGLLLDGKSGIFFGLKTQAKRMQYLSSKIDSIKLNHWHHIAGTYDGKRMRVYVDGVEAATKVLIDKRIDYTPENDAVIGIYKDDNEAYPFQGQIAEVRIWNKTRSAAEIKADMAHPLIGNEDGLIGYWPLNDGSKLIVEDKTNNANHGNMIGNFAWVETEITINSPELPAKQPDDQNSAKTQPVKITQNPTPMTDQASEITQEKPKSTKAKQKSKNNNVKYPYKILSIDGGGIRGIIPAIILREIERRTEQPIANLFDLIAGTSTGGVLALGLTKPKTDLTSKASILGIEKPAYTAQDLVSIFSEYGNVIFYETFYEELLGDFDEILKPKYTSQGKDEIFQQYFGKTKIVESLTEVLIPSYDIEKRMPVFFTSNIEEENIDSRTLRKVCEGFTMREAAMATTATPTYFPPYRIATAHNKSGYYTLVDGGMVANNPTSLAVVESILRAKAAKQRGEETWGLDNTLVLSLGTGSLSKKYPYDEAKNWGLLGWSRPMFNILLDAGTEAISSQVEDLLPQHEDKSEQQYYRFQGYLDESLESIDNAKSYNIRILAQVAKQIIEDRSEEIDSLCEKLVN